MKKLGYYLLWTGKSPVEPFFKNASYASIFVRWLLLQISGVCLIYSNKIADFIKITLFHAVGSSNTDKGRDLVFFWIAIFGMIIITIFAIGIALQIRRQREKKRKSDWVAPSEF